MTDRKNDKPLEGDVAAVKSLGLARQRMIDELRENIVGMEDVIYQVIIAIFSRGSAM